MKEGIPAPAESSRTPITMGPVRTLSEGDTQVKSHELTALPILRNIDIISASPEDIEGILSVQSSNLLSLSEKKPEELEQTGFLIYEVREEELNSLVSDKENSLVLVAKEDDGANGYALAYDLNLWKSIKPQWEETVELSNDQRKKIDEEKVLYLRHIARKEEARGVGSKLMGTLVDEAELRGYNAIIAEILEEPIVNRASTNFHTRSGFEKIGKVKESNNLTWGLFSKNLAATSREQTVFELTNVTQSTHGSTQ